MSNPLAKAERSAAKDVRQGITPQRGRMGSKKKAPPRPYSVFAMMSEGRVMRIHRSQTRDAAQAWIDKQCRSYGGKRTFWIVEDE